MESMEYLVRLCGYSYTTQVWFTLLEGGGAYGFMELLAHVMCSSATLTRCLQRLRVDGLVRMVNRKYQAIRPPWMRGGGGLR